MHSPDFARLGPPALEHRDLLFLFEQFPDPGFSAEESAQRLVDQTDQGGALDLLLESRYVRETILNGQGHWIDISPKLFFNIALRQALDNRRRDADERRTIHYLANLLNLFVDTERLYRVQPADEMSYEYLADLVQAAASADRERQFLTYSHIGNYALFLAGICAPWIEYRRRYKHRPMSLSYYSNMSRSHFASASRFTMADTLGLRRVFSHLAQEFDYYRNGLERVAERHLH